LYTPKIPRLHHHGVSFPKRLRNREGLIGSVRSGLRYYWTRRSFNKLKETRWQKLAVLHQCKKSSNCKSKFSHIKGLFSDQFLRYYDFFKPLYQTIQQKLQGELANRWEDASIEFIFSVPTTWKPVPTVERFRSIIDRAGFGRHPNHRADIGLTEAEAAAVHTARAFPKMFNVCLPDFQNSLRVAG
jgi:hypothetical protein